MADRIEIRKAVLKDIDAVCDIENKSFSVPWSREAFCSSIGINDFYVALSGENIAGYIIMARIEPEAEILNIAVAPEYRRKGIGERLIDYTFASDIENRIETYFLEVRESNTPAYALYCKKGFVQIGIRKDYYTKPKENAIIMSKYKEK